ncbi:MAG: hypothetical protein U9Q81_04710 [Pseudomonadota bacterium]|nr:hypothetical protein [Pseudomonadota bacterium]
MLGVLASITLIVGGASSTMVLSENDRLAAEESREPLVEIQTIADADTPFTEEARF